MIRDVHTVSGSWLFYPTRIQGSKRHRIPDPVPQYNGQGWDWLLYLIWSEDHLENGRGLPAHQVVTVILPQVRQPDVLVPARTEHLKPNPKLLYKLTTKSFKKNHDNVYIFKVSWRTSELQEMPPAHKSEKLCLKTRINLFLFLWGFFLSTSIRIQNTAPMTFIILPFKGTQEWEFFWLRFWILYYFNVSYE